MGKPIDIELSRSVLQTEIRAKEREVFPAWVENWSTSRVARWEYEARPFLRRRRKRLRRLNRLEEERCERARARAENERAAAAEAQNAV